MWPEGLSERLTELRRRRKLRAAVRAEAEGAVASLAFGTDPAVWIPDVPLRPARTAPEPRLAERGSYLAGLDASGRPVLVRCAFGLDREPPAAVLAYPSEETDEWVIQARVLRWDGARVEVIGFLTHTSVSHVTWIDHDEQGRPVRFATVGTPRNDFEKERKLAECDWDGDRCVRVRELLAGSSDRWLPIARAGEYDADGLHRIRNAVGNGAVEPGDAPAAAAELVPGEVSWRRDRDAYDPAPLPLAEAFIRYAEAVADAVRAVVTQPAAVIKVHPAFAHGYRPSVTVFDDAFVAAAAKARRPLEDLIRTTWADPVTEVLDAFDARGLAAWRSLQQHDVDALPADAERTLQERLAEKSWPDGALAVVWSGKAEMWALARAVYGDDRVAALGTDAPRPPLTVDGSPASRVELQQAVADAGLPPSVASLAAWGLALVPGGKGRSRLGGPAALPPSMAWPAAEGRPLTHLASLWLDELPEIEGRDLLPAMGVLTILADLEVDAELWEADRVGDDDRIVVLHTAGAVEEQEGPAPLTERRLAFKPLLTLPRNPDLPAPDLLAYEDLYEATVIEIDHLLLGHPQPVQYDSRKPGEVSLIQFGWDEDLGFEYLDGASIALLGTPDILRRGLWKELRVDVQSG